MDSNLSNSISEVDGLLGIHNIEEIGRYLASTIPPEERKPLFDDIFSSVLYDHKEAFMKPNKQFLEVLMIQSLYNNQDLKQLSLELLYSLYQSADVLQKSIDQLQIIQREDEIQDMKTMEETRKYLFRLSESIEIWYQDPDSLEFDQITVLLNRIDGCLHKKARVTEGADIMQEQSDSQDFLIQNPFLRTHLNRSF